jgi:type IV pilus assembly protein PilX
MSMKLASNTIQHRNFSGAISSQTTCHQRGITLVLVLIFIVSLSLIAAVGMRNVSMGERVVANERDRSRAFQGAESAGREAVAKISGGTASVLASGYYTAPLARGGNAEFWRTTSNLTADATCAFTDTTKRFDWGSCAASAASAYGNSTSPQYVIEKLPNVVVSPTITEQWYRVTSHASGGSNEADVILQLMFTTP